MPADEWKKANDRARYGPSAYHQEPKLARAKPGSKPDPGPVGKVSFTPKRKRRQDARPAKPTGRGNRFVSVGSYRIVETAKRDVRVELAPGRTPWVPRTVILDGNRRFEVGRVVPLCVRLPWADRERLPWTELPAPAASPAEPLARAGQAEPLGADF
jgi:hypothetical protein